MKKRVRIDPNFSRFFIIPNRINDAIIALVFCYFFKILLKYGFIANYTYCFTTTSLTYIIWATLQVQSCIFFMWHLILHLLTLQQEVAINNTFTVQWNCRADQVFSLLEARTTDAQRGNSLRCTAKNSLPLPNF